MKRILPLVLILAVLLSGVLFALPAYAASASAATAPSIDPIYPTLAEVMSVSTVEYYGRAALAKCEGAAGLLYAYDAIVTGLIDCAEEIEVYDGENKLSQDDLRTVFDAVRRDRAELFWIGNSYSVGYIGTPENIETVTTLLPTYLYTGDTLTAAKVALEAEVMEIFSDVDTGATDYEIALYLHDTLASRIEYVTDAPNAHNLYGAIVEGKAVCEGYAEALQYLLHRVGIEAFLAIGSSVNPTSGVSEGHEWSYAKLDGAWTHIDLTWDDQGDTLYHAYFGVTDAIITADHAIAATAYDLPVCDSTAADYFIRSGSTVSAPYSVSAVAEAMAAGGKVGHFAADDPKAFTEWFAENITSIASELGVVGKYTYGYSSLGREVVVNIDDCRHTSLTTVNATEADCTTPGNELYYSCDGCGRLFSDPLGLVETTASDVYIPALGHDFSKMTESADYLKTAGNCHSANEYWYACERCSDSAVNTTTAADKFYTGTTFGDHIMADGWQNEGGKHFHACTVEGCDHRTDEGNCEGGEATCLAPATCSTCGAEYGERGEHTYTTDYAHKTPDGHAHLCTVCGAHDDIIPHAGAEGAVATETEPLVCTDCGYIITPALSHGDNHTPREEWLYDADGHWHGCTGCEEQRLDPAPHTDADEDGNCDECGYVIPPSEDTPDKITDPLPELIASLTKEQVIIGAVAVIALILIGLVAHIALFIRRRSRW